MAIRASLAFPLFCMAFACGRGSDEARVDTTMVFVPAPPSFSPAPSEDSLNATLVAYAQKRVTAEAAARVIVDYVNAGHSYNAAFGPELLHAIQREFRRRARP